MLTYGKAAEVCVAGTRKAPTGAAHIAGRSGTPAVGLPDSPHSASAQLSPSYFPLGRWWAAGTSAPLLSETVAKKEVAHTVMRSGSWIASKGWSSQWPYDVTVTRSPGMSQ